MNKQIKTLLIVLGIITFIEVQVGLFFVIKTNIDINNNQPNINQPMNDRFNMNGDNSFPGNPPTGNQGNDDISKDAITPGNSSKRSSNSSNNI